MPDRLQHLRRQKFLLEEHLAWLDREIAVAEGKEPADVPVIAVHHTPSGTAHQPHETLGEPEPPGTAKAIARAEEIITRHKIAQASAPDDVRRGCLLLVVLGVSVLAISALLLWQFGPRR